MKNPRYFIDIETYSELDLPKHGAVRYAKDPSTVIHILSVLDIKTDIMTTLVNPKYIVGYENAPADKKRVKEIFMDLFQGRETYAAHSILFEYALIDEHIKRHIPGSYCKAWREATLNSTCTKDLAAIRGQRALSLADVATKLLGSGGKDMAGHNLMKLVCKPHKPGKKVSEFFDEPIIANEKGIFRSPEISEAMIKYCENDVRTTYDIWKVLKLEENDAQFGKFQPHMEKACRDTREANIDGVKVDVKLAELLTKAGGQYQEAADRKVSEVWGGLRATQSAKLKTQLGEWLPEGVENRGTGAGVLEYYRVELVKYPELFSKLEMLSECKSSSWTKAKKVLDIHVDGRIYDILQIFGARTGRWTSRGFQLQNLPRPQLTQEEHDVAMLELPSRINRGDISTSDREIISSALRAILLPDDGGIFFTADLSQIELRMGLYLAGDMEALRVQHTDDLYLNFARSVFGNHVTSKCKERHIGKTAILSLLYNTGAKTLRDMILSSSGVFLTLDRVKKMKVSFINQFPLIAAIWAKYDIMLKEALPSGKLVIKLKSGRKLTYTGIKRKLVPVERDGRIVQVWKTFHNDNGRDFHIYGSMIFNNVTQGSATDLFMIKEGAFMAHNEGFARFCFSVHDEVVVSVDKFSPSENLMDSWVGAGRSTIEKTWPGILLNSDFKMLEHYFK